MSTLLITQVEGRRLPSTAFEQVPQLLTTAAEVQRVLQFVDSCALCCGQKDENFVAYILTRKGKIMDASSNCIKVVSCIVYTYVYNTCIMSAHLFIGTKCVAFFDTKHSTIRCSDCKYLVYVSFPAREEEPCCDVCKQYRSNLRALVGRSEKRRTSECDRTDPSSHTPFQHLSTPEKARRYQREHALRKSCQRRIGHLLQEAAEERGFCEDKSLSDDLSQIMVQNAENMKSIHPAGSFGRIFWDSQAQAASLTDARQMRWDPMMVRWCLYLRHLSSSAYETLREGGFVKLPSQRTLRDYTHHTKAVVGFSKAVDEELKVSAKLSTCLEREKCVILILDEMHLREDLSYDKHTGMSTR